MIFGVRWFLEWRQGRGRTVFDPTRKSFPVTARPNGHVINPANWHLECGLRFFDSSQGRIFSGLPSPLNIFLSVSSNYFLKFQQVDSHRYILLGTMEKHRFRTTSQWKLTFSLLRFLLRKLRGTVYSRTLNKLQFDSKKKKKINQNQ